MKRIIVLVSVLLLIVCTGSVFAGGQSGNKAEGKMSMTLITIGYNDEEIQLAKSRPTGFTPQDAFWIANREKIEAKFPDVQIEWADWGWGEALDAKQRTAIAAGTPPTNISGESFIPAYIEAGMLREIPSWVMEGIDPSFVLHGRDGKPYAITYQTSVFMLFYNKNLLKNAGLDPEAPPKTWSEWKSMADQITARGGGRYWGGGIPSFPHNGGALRATPFFRQMGTDFGDGDKVYLDDPKVQQTLQFIRDMNANFPPGLANGMDEGPLWNAFALRDQQNIGFVVDGAWNQTVSTGAGLTELGIAPLPIPDTGGQVGNCQVGARFVGVPVGISADIAETFWRMFKDVVVGEDNQRILFEDNLCTAPQSLLRQQAQLTDPKFYSGRVAAGEFLKGSIPVQAAFYKNNSQVWEILNEQVLARTTMTNTPIGQICSEAKTRIDALLR